MFKKYRTGELLSYLGVSRDTLRYYEEKGLLSPKKNNVNNYRDYDIFDVYTIMIIDFYKKRGMTTQQIQALLKDSDITDLLSSLDKKEHEIEERISELQSMKDRIAKTKSFAEDVNRCLNKFEIRPMPLYRANGEVSDFVAVEEYENVLDDFGSCNDDMLSQIMRYISFDENGATGTKILIVSSIEENDDEYHCLHYPKCIYTIREERQPNNEDIMKIMHSASRQYAKEHGLVLTGEAFAIIRLITHKQSHIRAFMEIYLPFK